MIKLAVAHFASTIRNINILYHNKLKPTDSFRLDLLADDTDCRELILAFQNEFGMDIPPDDLEKIDTVQHVINYAKEHGK